jgi:hypothetical protein
VALLIVVSFLQRHGDVIQHSVPEGEAALAH